MALKPENYSDVQRAMEERLNIPQSSDIRQSIISATEKIVHNKTARFFENSDMSEAEKNNFRKLISDATAYEVCKSCGFKTEDMPELFSDNIYVDMADAISATVSGISSIIMQSIENNVRISDERIRNERENNNGNITAESYERTGADASSNNRGRTDSGIDPRRTNEVGRAETSGTAAINADNAYSRGSDGNQNTADENAGSIYNRTLRTDEVRISGTADAAAPGVSDREQAAERTPGTSAGERGNRVQEIYPQSGNAGRGMAESNRNGQLHNEEPIVQQLPNDSRGRTDESLDLHRTRGNNGIIGKATFKYIRDKKYVKGNTDDMLKVAARLDAENISFSGRISDESTTITVSGAELQNKVRQYLDEVQHSSNLRRFERKDSFTEKEAAVNAFYGGFTVYDANGKKAENEDDIGYEAYYDPTEYVLSLTSDAYEEPYCFFNAMFEEYAVDDIVQTFEKAEEAFTYGREHLNMVNISDAEALVEMDKQKDNSPLGNVIPETPKESLLRIAFNEYNDFVNSITTTAEAIAKATEIADKQKILKYFDDLNNSYANAILAVSDKPVEFVYNECLKDRDNDISVVITNLFSKTVNAEKEYQISEAGNVISDMSLEDRNINYTVLSINDNDNIVVGGLIDVENVYDLEEYQDYIEQNLDVDTARIEFIHFNIGADVESEDANEADIEYIENNLGVVMSESTVLDDFIRKIEIERPERTVFELAENYEIVFSAAEFEDGTRHIFPGSITEEDVWNSDVWNEVRNRNVDYDNITDLDESLKVKITHCTYGRGNTLTPNQDILDEINENFDEIRLNSQILSVEETYLYLYKDIDDVLSELEKAAQEQHQREPQVSDGFDNSNFLLPDNLSPIARSGGREYYQIDEAVKAIKLNEREWLDTFDAVVAMNKKGVNVNDIEMLNVHYVSADGSSGYKDITPEQYIVYRNHTEERPQQMKAALQHFKDRISNSRNHLHFADDAEKMADFKLLTKEEFLESYSYLSEAEYNATAEHLVNEKIKQYFETGLPNVIRRTHAHDEMEDLVKETATDQFNNTEYQNTIARKYIGSGTINFPDNFFDDVKKEFTSLGLDADNFSVKIICTVDNVTLENSNISVTHSWDDAVTACLTAAEDYSNGENDYVIKTIAHFIEEEKIKKAIADKGDIHFNAGNDNYIIAYDKEAESYFLEVKRPHSTDYERLREIRIETSDNVYGEMIWNSGKITGFSKDYSTDVDIPRDEFIEWAVKNLASMPYIQNAHNDEAKFRHLVRDNLYTLLYEYATGDEQFNNHSIADFEKFFNKYINDAAELESIIYVVHNDANENVLRIEKAKEVAEKADLPFSSRLIDGDEDFDPYVYDGTMSLEDVEKMHELIAEDKFEIYQIKSGEEYRDKRFTDYNSLSASPVLEDYDLVYSGSMSELGISNLEEIYVKFNLNHPEGFTGHSLSVSDIVVLHNEGDKYYYVDSVGYKDVTEEIIMSLNRDEQGNLNLAARLYDYAKNNLTYEWQDETEGAEIDITKLDESLKDAETRKRIISYLEESDFDGTESLINDIKALDEANAMPIITTGTIEKYGLEIDFSKIESVVLKSTELEYIGGIDSDGHERKDNYIENATEIYLLMREDYDGNIKFIRQGFDDFLGTYEEDITLEEALKEIEEFLDEAAHSSNKSAYFKYGYDNEEYINPQKLLEAKKNAEQQNEPTPQKKSGNDIEVGDRFLYKEREYTVTSMLGVYPNDVGVSYFEQSSIRTYQVTSNIDKYELANKGVFLGNFNKKAEREYSFLAPDTTVTVQQMNEYGYDWDGMLPLSAEKAKELYNQNVEIYKLYSDNTEGVVESIDELDDNVMFGVQKNVWEQYCFVNSVEYAELINDITNDDEIKSAFDDKNTFRSIIQKKVTEYAEAEETTLADYLNDTRNKYPDTYEQLQAIVVESAAKKLADDISMPPFNRLRAAHNFTAEQLQIINRLEMTVEANKYMSVSSDIMNNGAWQMQYGGFDRINNRIFNGTLPDIFDELNGYMNPGVIETEKFPSGELEQDEEEQTSLFNDAPGRISSDEINLSDFDDVVDEPISKKEIIGGITVTCEWSESNVFEGGKMYTVAEFDRLMAAADSEKTEGWENGIEEYGSAEAFELMDKERYYKYLGYEKTRFTINFPNGTTISERQDIGDGFGGLISYCKTFPSLQQYVPLLEAQRDLDNLKSGYVEENKNSPMGNNFKITDDFSIDSGAKTRFRNNVEAIKLLNTIEAENRLATPDEQKILAKYVGWGGLSKAFDATDATWQREYNELKELLPESEYNSARGSVLNAHYTTATVINAIYQGLENLGFEGGRILEPAMGTGNFFGAMPQNMADNSQLVGVELDGITGRIAKQLYQNADIQVTGFEKTKFADNSFDVAVGNVPFGAYKLMDKKYDKENFYIHDYFFAKALDKVKPGGVVAFVTSKGTLDKQNPEVRKYLAQRAELVGAIRLPNNAFKANAGTEVTTDIIFLQKRDRMIDIEPDWVHLGMTENGLAINKYFIDHPEMVLGTIVEGNKLYGNQSNETMCVPIEGADLGEQLAEAVKNIKGQITGEITVDEAEKEDERAISATPGVGFYRYAVVDGNIYYRMNGDMMYPVDKPQQKDRTIAMVELRDTVHKLLDAEMDNANNRNATEISILRKTLNKQYDNFAEKYGRITSKVNKKAFENDNSYHLLASLEKYDSDNNYIGKADIFEKSTVKPRIVTEHVDTAADALILSVSEKAKVDFEYMQQLTDMDKDTLIQELGNKIYQIPNSDKWVTADEYLSGNIRKKLAEAKAAGMEVNIQALEMAMPPTIDAADIDAKLGAAWIKPEYVQQFIIELLDPPHNTRKKIDVVYSEYGDKWKIEGYKSNYYNSNVTEIYGIPEYNAYEIIEQTLNMKSVEVRKTLRDERGFPKLDKNGNEIRVIDAEKTAIVQSKQKEIKRKFAEWAFKDPDRRNDLVQTFNERFNSVRLREFDGSNLNFVGMNSEIKLRKHQVDAVARQLYNGNTLLAHEVGAGKTFEMIAAAMEGKRLGLHNKSMFAVPNHLTEQFATDFRKLYPNCNILVATKKDMDTQHRRDFMAKIATGDYDAVILGHSQFDRIHLSPELESEYIQDELEDLRNALNEAKANAAYGEKSFSVKQIELAIKSREQQLERTKAKIGDDNVISFERLGIDKLFVDESHAYKNLDIATKMTRVAGLGGKGSGRSLGLLMKCKYLNEKTDFKGITFASGTPVSNSMTELYTIMRYLEPQKMADAGIRTFDNWASVFAETEQSNELKPECDGKFQTKTRISKYSCFEQLMTMYGEVADVKTAEMMKLPRPEAAVEVIKAPATRAVLREMRKLSSRASEIRKGEVDPKVDNMLKLTLDGKKIGLDLRLMNPYAKDDPNSKVNLCVNKVMDIYKETTPTSGVQMIFCDLSTPKKENPNSYAIYKKDAFGDYQLAYTTGLKKTDTFESLQKKFSNSKSLPKDYDKETYGKLDADDVIVLHTTDENGNVTNTAQYITSENTLEIASDGLYEEIGVTPYVSADELTKQFCVYEDIKEKLIKNGVPEEEIAFIHDYDKPEDKQKLYNQMNEGKVRVMIGSTGKCGAGMNAQKKMIALHHLDVPARPSDIEQRNGRIQRQGNENENVRIFRYITDRTFDAYSYQILENKQKFISQIMSGEIRVKTCEDIDEKALDYAEVKALCAGNPMIKEKIDLETQVNELRILKAAFDRQKYDLQDKALRKLPEDIADTEVTIHLIKSDIQTLNTQTKAIDDEGKEYYPITFNGTTYSSKEDAGNALKACMLQAVDGKEVRCGTYRGFDISVVYDTFGKDFKAVIRGAKKYYCPLNADPNVHASGNIRRLDNALGNIEKVLEEQYSKLENLKTSLEIAKNSADEEFPQLAELHEKENRLSEVEQQLQLSEAVDTTINVDLYAQLTELFPTIMSKQDSYVKLEAGEAFDSLNVQWISEKEIAVSHTYEQNGDLMYDPEIVFQVDATQLTATAISYEQSNMGKYETYETLAEAADCNTFASEWFDNIEQQGYEPVEQKSFDEEIDREPVRNDNAR